MGKTVKRDARDAANVQIVAELAGVTDRYVRYVLTGQRKEENIFTAFMMLAEGQNNLIQAVKEAVPFN